jgi:type VI secretion system secreted protein Hcp
MKLKLILATALLAVVVGTAGTLAWARTQADDTINACVASSSGDLRIPPAGEACKKNETRTSWSVTGPQGPPGPQGPAGPAGGSAAAADALQGSFTATGTKQGAITGDGSNGTMILIGLSHEIRSPRDAASGLPTGKRQHKPLTIRKELDKSTPKLLMAMITNENLSNVTFTLTRSGSPYMTIKLTNASVASRVQTGTTEEIEFTYQKIEWTWTDGGITAMDDWESPIS